MTYKRVPRHLALVASNKNNYAGRFFLEDRFFTFVINAGTGKAVQIIHMIFKDFLLESCWAGYGCYYKSREEFNEHYQSGEVQMPIPNLLKIYEDFASKNGDLPSQHQIGDCVWFQTWSANIIVNVIAIHFYTGKVKYDLELFSENGDTTRIYNVDSAFVVKQI